MFWGAIKEINAAYPADYSQLDEMKRVVKENCLAADYSSRDIHALQLVVEEVATNIIRHSYKYEKGKIALKLVIYKNKLVLSLTDFGRSFQPDFAGSIDLKRLIETGRKGGLGFYMVQKIMDSVEYISTPSKNEMRMVKRLKPEPERIGTFGRMMPLRVKFSVSTFIILAAIIGVSYYFINHQTTQQVYSNLNDKVVALGTTIADQTAGYMLNSRSDVEFDELIVSYLRANPELKLIVITDTNSIVLAHSQDIRNIRKSFEPPESMTGSAIVTEDKPLKHSADLNYMSMPVKAGQNRLGTVHVTFSTAAVAEQLLNARVAIVRLTMVLLLFGMLGIYLLSNYFVDPIARITRRVKRFTSGESESELPLEGAEEFFEISRAFNQMITRINRDRKIAIEQEGVAKEIEVASQIQKSLLPKKLPELPGLELDAYYKSASQVGGDLYDVMEVGDKKYCLVIADVSGKGVPASMVMSMLRTVLRIYSQGQSSAKKVLLKTNAYLKDNIPPGIFITAFVILYEADKKVMTAVSAGHNPMLYRHGKSGKIERINPGGMPLGMPGKSEDDFARSLKEVKLEIGRGDTFLLYTDGVTETSDSEGVQFGIDRLLETFDGVTMSLNGNSVDKLSSKIIRKLKKYSGDKPFSDDITMLLGRFGSPPKKKTDSKKIILRALAENRA
ncbi:MAG: SpoIIE family protein phosphatase [candidate division Zixibacteria bacterium]|nr:SpoIIE family protein phosphatase [candidate division Zixibacteria bacterium]